MPKYPCTLEGHDDFVYSLSFSPDGQTLASASADQSVILWNLNLDDLIARGCQWAFAYIQRTPGDREGELPVCSDSSKRRTALHHQTAT